MWLRRWGLLCAIASVWIAPLARAQYDNDPQMADARQRFAEAEQIFARGDHAGALAEFQRIYDTLEGHPRRFFVLYNIARCQEELFRYSEALDNFRRYLAEGGAGTDLASSAQQKIATLEGRLAILRITTNASNAEVWVDGHMVGTAPGDVRVAGGSHAVELRADGYAPARRDVQIAARTTQDLSIELESVISGVSPAFFIAGASLTAIAAGIAIGFGAVALSEQNALSANLASSDERMRFMVTQARIDSMEQMALLADVFFATAAVFGIASLILIFVTDWGMGGEESDYALVPVVSPTAGGLALEGGF
jgi:tetratricopeptide (TPR) repeat protein